MLIKKCSQCKKKKDVEITTPIYSFCSYNCAILKTKNNAAKSAKSAKKKTTDMRAEDKARLKALMTRSQWYQRLQRVVNQYVTKVRDVDKFCATCGTVNENIQYDAGHYIAVGKNMDLRFELTNIHKQCSVQCNQFGRGMPVEYDEFIKNKYGLSHYNWLNTKFLCHKPHPTLKELFPTWQDIEAEVNRYASILKENGIKPNLRNYQ